MNRMNTVALSPWLEWEEARPLIAAAVVREGFPSLTAYAVNFPQADLLDLSSSLAIARVHSGQLRLRLWEEAAEAGTLARCARDLLVRALCEKLHAWWESGGPRARYLEDAFYAWREELPENYKHVEDKIRSAMLTVEPPADWVPEHADDSILVSLFEQHWPAEHADRHYRLKYHDAGSVTIEAEREHDGEALVSGSQGAGAQGAGARPSRATSSVAFDRAMVGVNARCSHLTTLLDSGHLDLVEQVARSAVNLWLAGSAAYRRLAWHDEPIIANVKATRGRLDAMCLQVLDGMRRACALLEMHPSRNTFDDLCMQLITAAAQLDIDAATRGVASPTNV